MAPTIQKGTRCGCRNPEHGGEGHKVVYPMSRKHCNNDAVRMVTVRVLKGGVMPSPSTMQETFVDVPLCAPCAAFAEGRVAR